MRLDVPHFNIALLLINNFLATFQNHELENLKRCVYLLCRFIWSLPVNYHLKKQNKIWFLCSVQEKSCAGSRMVSVICLLNGKLGGE